MKKATILPVRQGRKSLAIDFLSAITCGLMEVTAFTTLDVAQTYMQVQKRSAPKVGLIGVLRRIYTAQGIRGLFRGYSTMLLSIPTTNAVFFPMFYNLKTRIGDMRASVAAGLTASFLTTPLFVVKTRIQAELLTKRNKF